MFLILSQTNTYIKIRALNSLFMEKTYRKFASFYQKFRLFDNIS